MYENSRTLKKEETYNRVWKELHELCQTSDELYTFYEYMDKNWHPIRMMWANHVINSYNTLCSNTNNRSESNNASIKRFVKLHSKFSDCFEQLLRFLKRQYSDYNLRNYSNHVSNFKPTNIESQLEQDLVDKCNEIVNKSISKRVREEFKTAMRKVDKGEITNISLEKNQTTCSFTEEGGRCAARSFKIPLFPFIHYKISVE